MNNFHFWRHRNDKMGKMVEIIIYDNINGRTIKP